MLENNVKEKLAKLIAAIDKADSDKLISFKPTKRDFEGIQISVPETLINDEEFNGLLLGFGVIPSRLRDQKKALSKNRLSAQHILAYIDTLQEVDIEELNTLVKEFTNKPLKELNYKQIAGLVLQLFRHWLKLPGELKKHRNVNLRMVKGYLKQRETYTHKELTKALDTYGKWAQARSLAKAADDERAFWFHQWDFDELLTSNKAMNHLDAGWKHLTFKHKIPDEYANPVRVQHVEENPEDRLKEIAKYMAQDYVKYGTFAEKEWNYNNNPELKKLVDAELERLRNAN